MSTLVQLQPLNPVMWQAWEARGLAEERKSNATRVKAATWISIAALLTWAGLWSYLAPFEVVLRFLVAIGACVLVYKSWHARRYAIAAMFGALVLLYNPVMPLFSLSSDWLRIVLVVSAIPFFASLDRRSLAPVKAGTSFRTMTPAKERL